jgi:TPR repeat protein
VLLAETFAFNEDPHAGVLVAYALLLLNGDGVPQNLARAEEILLVAASVPDSGKEPILGVAQAKGLLSALLYAQREAELMDDWASDGAFKWLDHQCLLMLGNRCSEGSNYHLAFDFYRMAVERANHYSASGLLMTLGERILRGQGAARNADRALCYLNELLS